ncbi:GIY-YIG nuclease family protein [Mycobacterium adipatum]|uniref:GIY-YIG nuclease family protein n=1 Tax=Mycobacterium adipatum TaxID=1682113 RepID=UPI0034E08857
MELNQIPDRCVLYRIFDSVGALLYVGATTNPGVRFRDHGDHRDWWAEAATITLEHLPTWDMLTEAEAHAIRTENPKYNHLHCKPSPWARKPRNTDGGTIFQRKDDGLWIGRVYINGKRRQVSSKDRSEAERKLAELQQAEQ